jgi:hypothetical protein
MSCCPGATGAVYEVSIAFNDLSIIQEYHAWLSGHHINEVLNFDGFISAELLQEYNGTGLTVRYLMESTDTFEKYNSSDTALRLRKEALEKFGSSKFSVCRRVLIASGVFYK